MLLGLRSRCTTRLRCAYCDRGADDAKELEALAHRQVATVAVAVERLALDVLHDEVGQPVVGGAAVEQPGDVGMLEAGQDLPLAAKVTDASRRRPRRESA